MNHDDDSMTACMWKKLKSLLSKMFRKSENNILQVKAPQCGSPHIFGIINLKALLSGKIFIKGMKCKVYNAI